VVKIIIIKEKHTVKRLFCLGISFGNEKIFVKKKEL